MVDYCLSEWFCPHTASLKRGFCKKEVLSLYFGLIAFCCIDKILWQMPSSANLIKFKNDQISLYVLFVSLFIATLVLKGALVQFF